MKCWRVRPEGGRDKYMLRYLTAGETHGKQLTVIIEGMPAGLKISAEDINSDLARRQHGFGRGERMAKIENDKVEIVSGVRLGETMGSPITLVIKNMDWQNWGTLMGAEFHKLDDKYVQTRPRPGHADLSGVLKYNSRDIRDILERASARETAARVAAGAVAKKLNSEFGITVVSFVREIGGIKADIGKMSAKELYAAAEKSFVRTPDKEAEQIMIEAIILAKESGDTLGGVFSVVAEGVPAGLGSHAQWDRKLDAKIAMALMSIQAIKGVEFGLGFGFSAKPGSGSHDEIFHTKAAGFFRRTNNAGGIEGGMSNGENIFVNCVMKPIPSLKKPLRSVDIHSKKAELAEAVRSDVCAVPAAGVVGEAALSFELACALQEKFGGDSLNEMKVNFKNYIGKIKKY